MDLRHEKPDGRDKREKRNPFMYLRYKYLLSTYALDAIVCPIVCKVVRKHEHRQGVSSHTLTFQLGEAQTGRVGVGDRCMHGEE